MEALEERARKRLELEEVRQKRVALELQLEARRKDAEAAQRRLAELSGKAAVARVPSEGGQSDGGEAELDAEPDPAQSHAVINERIAQRRREREKQSQVATKKLDELNARRLELQQEQDELKKRRVLVAAEAAKERAEAAAIAREEEAALNIRPPPPPDDHGGAGQERTSGDDKSAKDRKSAPANAPDAHAMVDQGARQEARPDRLELQVLPPEDIAHAVAKSVPNQEKLIAELTQEFLHTSALSRKPLPEVAKLNEMMRAEDIVTHATVAEQQRRWQEQGAAINRQLKKEAFEKAIRAAMRLLCDEVVLAVVADVAAEGDFVHYWAQSNAGSLLVDALLHPSYVAARNANTSLTAKQVRDKTNSLFHILSDYRRRRELKRTMHVHTIHPVHSASQAMMQDMPSKPTKSKLPVAPEVIEADKLLLYMDLPPDRAEEQKTDIRAREQAYWEGITPLPIFLSGLKEGVLRVEPSPDANQLALLPVKSGGIVIYDIRHLPPRVSRKRAAWGAGISQVVWSADSTQLVALDSDSVVSVWSVRADRQQGAQGVLSSSGAYETLNLVDSHVFPALVDGKTKRVSASDLERLVDVRDGRNYLGASVFFHPCLTLAGQQPSVMLGLRGGMMVKMNNAATEFAVFGKCCVDREAADVAGGGGGGPVAPGSHTPLREYFVRHQHAVLLVASVFSGQELVSLDESGLVCVWKYIHKTFSAMGWFTPTRAIQVVIADATFQDDLSVKKQSAFPSWFAGQGPDVEKDPLAFKKLSAEYVERLQEDHNIDPSKPFEVKAWKETSWAGRAKDGWTHVHKGHDIDHAAGRCYFHVLKYTSEGMLLSHMIAVRSRQVTRGFLIRARVDYSGKRLVVLSYLPPGGPRRHGHLATLFHVDLRDPISLVGPRIDLPLPDSMCKSIERKTQDPALSETQRNALIRPLLHGLDFDIAPPQGSTGVHVAHVLLANTVYTFSLETGQQLMEPLMPLVAQKRRGTLSCIRCVAKFDVQAGHHRDPFAAPPEEHEDPDTPSSYEHLIICSAPDVPTVFMYSVEPAAGHRVVLTPNQSQGSSRMPSRGGLDEQAALVSAAHQRALTRQQQLTRGAATGRASATNKGPR